MTGAWIPRKGPSSALFLITDTRPLVLRAVGSRSSYFCISDYYCLSSQVPYILSFSLFMILAGLTLPRTSGMSSLVCLCLCIRLTSVLFLDYSLIYYFALWFTLVAFSTFFIIIH